MASDKNLPIRIFQKRQKDERDTEGGGSGALPKWVDSSKVGQKSAYVRNVLDTLSIALSTKVKRNNYIPTVIKLKVNEDALAKTYRREIGNLFNVGKLNIIGVAGEDEVLIKVDNIADLEKMIANFERIENTAFPSNSSIIGVSAITDVKEFKPQIDVVPDPQTVLKIKLFNYGDLELNGILMRTFEKYCRDKKIDFKGTSYSADLNIYSVNGVTKDIMAELREFDGVQLITEMPTYDLTFDELTEENSLPIKKPQQGKEYPIVGILDSGIASIPHLTPWLVEESITYFPDEYVNKRHGTFVAGVLLYGDELEGKSYTGLDGCRLFEAVVMPDLKKQQMLESDLITQIRDAISRNAQIKIWNMSLGTTREADLYEFSDFAKALDEIQEHNDVIIIKSAGNCGNFRINAPKGRITNSADTVRGIVVGSLAHEKGTDDQADKHNPSPFSRKGPGPSHIIKPDVVHIGGNAGINASSQLVTTPVKSFTIAGGIAKEVGTSFSTPRVSAIVAGLDFMLKEDFNSTLLKALVIHSAKHPEEMKMSISDKISNTGFGMPSSIRDILYNEPNEITLILQDTLERGNFIEILDFPFPESMVDEQGYFYGEITITLVTAPILEVSQGAEYCQSNIDVMFGSYDYKKERDTTKQTVKNPIGAEGRQNLLDTSLYSSKINKNLEAPFSKERVLVAYGNKYQPVKKWSVNFDEFTPTNKEKYLKSPKNWYLKLEGLYRHFTETKCEMQKIVPSQEFSLIITIKDTKKRGNIYNEVTQLLDSFSFIHNNVKIREEVVIKVNNN